MAQDSAHRARHAAAAQLIAQHRDLLDERPGPGGVPAALDARDWAGALAALDDRELAAHEQGGLEAAWAAHTPRSLVDLQQAAREVCAIPLLPPPSGPPRPARVRENPRKRAQIDAFVALALPLARRATRVVDVGSGHGHLTRQLAERLALPVLGLERDPRLAGRARSLPARVQPRFTVTDVLGDGLPLRRGELAIGLHACGELGDLMVQSAARVGAALVLVGCCLQKRRSSSRPPLCRVAEALTLPTALLGLSNLTAREQGVEATRAENLAARERRLALHHLLSAHRPLALGAELAGLNRRAAHLDWPALAARALAVRGWPPAAPAALAEAAAWAAVEHARLRRFALPRALLARVLEVFVLLDRACYLEQHGFAVTTAALFPPAASARNLVVVGSPPDL